MQTKLLQMVDYNKYEYLIDTHIFKGENMNTFEITKKIMRTNSIFAKKSFGQNFLIDDNILKNIVESADLKENDLVIEIGPGLGNLTHYILEKKAHVIAFEIDTDMIDILNDRFQNSDNLEIVNQDILKVDLREYIKDKKVKIIANLPYYITTPIIFKLLEYRENICSITIMIQKEVADRIVSKPHSKDYGVLTINTNYLADVKKLFNVPNTSFVPAPNVTSSVIQIVPNKEKEERLGIIDHEMFKELVKKSFSARRKKLSNSLTNTGINGMSKQDIDEMIESVGLDLNVRAEEVSIENYVKMANIIAKDK